MAQGNFRSWRGYLYVALGLGFGIYRAVRVTEWTSWDFFDQCLALGMIAIGVYLVIKK